MPVIPAKAGHVVKLWRYPEKLIPVDWMPDPLLHGDRLSGHNQKTPRPFNTLSDRLAIGDPASPTAAGSTNAYRRFPFTGEHHTA